MDMCAFAIWKFRTIEGVAENVRCGDVTTTHYDDGRRAIDFLYDMTAEQMQVVNATTREVMFTCPFKNAVDELKKRSLYRIRTENRHSCSYPPDNTI